jgi:hypothetical protein
VWKLLFLIQGWYYFVSGVWPIVHIQSFVAVTGPKTDLWLVKTVGALVVVIGLALVTAARRGSKVVEMVLLAIGSAFCLGLIDVVYGLKGVISPVYYADAGLEFLLAALLIVDWYQGSRP